MSVPIPDFEAMTKQIHAAGGYDLTTKEGCGNFTRAVAAAAYERDQRFRMLEKSPGQNHVVDNQDRRHAVDAILFLENPSKAIAIDIIGSSASAKAKPTWNPDKVDGVLKYRYTEADSFIPNYEGPIPGDNGDPVDPPAPVCPAPPPPKPRPHYGVWLDSATTIASELTQHRGGYAPTDLVHFLYGLIEEGRELDAIVTEIRGH